ncbi:MAG: methyltransferase domain-containing protein [Oligoflexus sp.]|nr:methyltransferase domain-containing protein [Oligoflexus sp.]
MQSQEEKKLWQERWQKGMTGWDQGAPHPSLFAVVEHAKLEGGLPGDARFFSAGCGRAHSEAALAEWGYHVRAIDLSEEAIREAQSIYGKLPNLELKVADLFQLETTEAKSYDAIYDRAMLCALPPESRRLYIDAMKARLKDLGLFCCILFRDLHTLSHPPYAVDEAEAFRLLGKDFVLCYAAAVPAAPIPAAVKEEWISIWRVRGAP